MTPAQDTVRQTIAAWLDEVPLRRRVIAYVQAQGVLAYLVGGTVRDALLRRPGCDVDIVVGHGAMALARQVADHIRGAYVALDPERDVARVVIRVGDEHHHFDFASLRAGDIEGDLWARDFTINAIAVRLVDGLGELLDPTGGQADLAGRVLRAVGASALADDPLRILRGVRLRGALGFPLTPETEALARVWLPELRRVSAERIRDELALILALPEAAASLDYAAGLGVLSIILPEVEEAGPAYPALPIVDGLEAVFGAWATGAGPEEDAAHEKGIGIALGRYREALHAHWSEELSFGRTRWVALKLAALVGGLPNTGAAREVAQRLRFSSREADFVATVYKASRILAGWMAEGEPDALQLYRYYRAAGEAGIDAAILALMVRLAGTEPPNGSRLLARVERMLGAWFDDYQRIVDPPQLLSGHDVMAGLHIRPGPELGELLERLREAQAQGLVQTREEALRYLRQGRSPA